MRKFLSTSLTALLLTGVAAAPLATAFTVLSADAAFAKSDKAKGKPDKAKKPTKSNKPSGAKGGKPEHAGKGNGNNPLGGLFNKLTGKDKAAAKPAKKTVGDTGMHPSELGNMNGALNANINAVLAHIRNGNTNGPVGVVAQLAVANAAAADATDLLAAPAAGEYVLLEEAVANSEYATIEEYLAAKAEAGDGFVVDDGIESALSNLGSSALDAAVDANGGYDSAADYFLAKAEAEGGGGDGTFVVDENIEAASAALGVYNPDEAAALEDAADAIMAQADAEAAALTLWNKNPDTDPETISEEEQALLDALNGRLVGFEDEIAGAIEASETHGSDGEGDDDTDLVEDDCDDDDPECEIPGDEDIVLIIE